MNQLISRFGKSLEYNNVLKEYPRPMMVRDSYINLNGVWKYEINKDKDKALCKEDIVVPFSPETYLSGVQKILKPDEFLHYRKTVNIPDGFIKSRVILHFGAVDQECEIKLNGHIVGSHKGGYLPFQFNITEYLVNGENVLDVSVVDKTEFLPHARGKQRLNNKGLCSFIFYTPSSGIWKSVWLESVDERYITSVKAVPNYDDSSVKLLVNSSSGCDKAKVEIFIDGKLISESTIETNKEAVIKLDGFREWTPENPNLYDVVINYNGDVVKTYFGMRKISHHKDEKGIERFYLNNKPYFFNGVLNQGYWPESLLTAPSDEALKDDILKLKELGFNTIRCHVKVEDERFYYYCDKIGMAVWQDMPNGGGSYDMLFQAGLANVFPWTERVIRDNQYWLFRRRDKQGRQQYYEDLAGMIEFLYSHPSVVVWVPFNEGWGQFDANEVTEFIRGLDSMRLVNQACGWFDQKGGDIYSIHNYHPGLKIKPRGDRVVALTEFGGYTFPIDGHCFTETHKGYKKYSSKEELTDNYVRLMKDEVLENIKNGLCASIYTQTTDVENEVNGFMTYDREVFKMDEEAIRESNRHLYEEFDSVMNIKVTAESVK